MGNMIDFTEVGTVSVDNGRVTLKKQTKEKLDGYKQFINSEGTIMLVPYVHVPMRDIAKK